MTVQVSNESQISRSVSTSSVSSSQYIFSKLLPWVYTDKSLDILGRQGRKALIFAFIQALVMTPLEIALMVLIFIKVGPNLPMGNVYKRAGFIPFYAFISILGQIFQFYLSYEAALYKNTVQVVFIAIFNILHLLFCILQSFEWALYRIKLEQAGLQYHRAGVLPLTAATACIMFIFVCMSAWNAFVIYKEFGWSLYERNGASLEKKKMLNIFHTYSVLLKLCGFFSFTIPLQIMWGVILDNIDQTTDPLLTRNTALWWTWIVSVFITIVLFLYYGQYAVGKGNKALCILVFSLLSVNTALIVIGISFVNPSILQYVFIYFIFFVVISVGLNIVALVYGVLCFLKIKNGLSLLGNILWNKELVQAQAEFFHKTEPSMRQTIF